MDSRSMRAAALGVLLVLTTAAIANITEPAIQVVATNATGTATFTRPLSAFTPVDGFGYFLDVWSSVPLVDPGNHQTVASLTGLHVQLSDDPAAYAGLSVGLSATAGNTDTTFTITPGIISFDPIPAPFAAAVMSWGFTCVDSAASGDSHVLMQGVPTGDDIYKAWYDGTSPFGGSAIALQASSTPPGSGAVASMSDTVPLLGYTSLGVPVDEISAQTAFTLTHLDTADVNMTYWLDLPEPSALGLAALGVVTLVRRRR